MTDVEGHGRQMEALHLYCVVGNGMALDLRLTGLDGRQASAIRHRDIAAVMGPVPMRAYRAMKREEVIPYLFAHQAVIEKILAERTVVPVKFGTTARDEEEVRTILEKGYPQLRAALEAMGGKIELDVVALWRDLDSLLREIGEEDEIRRAKAAIATRSSEETREERVRIGQMVKARLDRRREEAAAEIVEALEGLVLDMCPHAVADDWMILNTAVLVERSREGEVGQALHGLNGRYAERVDFRCVGPLPPYSFSTVEIQRFEAEKIEWARRLLGLGGQAGALEAKRAYRRLAHRCHPDKAPIRQGTGERFEEVTDAYRMLADYYAAAEQAHPGAEATGVVAVKLFRWGAEAGVV
ncbi:MAG: GvpL/GvpF family gas vesicle protein [candidate division NC10 bacterium]|nr:GvpL/GvpF family gas vesicle protein [candidate division NC10 bacterium]